MTRIASAPRFRLIVGACVLLVFGQTLAAGFVWDDVQLIERNEHLRGPGALRDALTADFSDSSVTTGAIRSYWRPVPKVSHVLLTALGGGSAAPFHATNVLLHLGVCLLVFEWLRRRLGNDGVEHDWAARGAFAGALVFALHPSRFEGVGWVSSVADLFFALFVLAAATLVELERGAWRVPLVLAFFALATWSKETGVILPVLLFGDALVRGRLRGRGALLLAAAGGVGVALVSRAALGHPFPSFTDDATLAERGMRTLGAFAGYHLRTVLPLEATVVPLDVPMVRPSVYEVPPLLWGSGLVLVGAWLAFAVWALRRRAVRPAFADALLWLFLLAPVLQLRAVPSPVLVTDRYLYGAMWGFSALVARAFAAAARPGRELVQRRLGLALFGLSAASALMLSLALPAFADNLTLFERESRLHPDNAFVLEAYARSLTEPSQRRLKRRVLERMLERPLVPLRRAAGVVSLAQVEASLLTDADVAALERLRGFFDAVRAGTPPPLLALAGKAWEMPTDPGVITVLLHQEQAFIDEATFTLHLRLGQSASALQWARAEHARAPSLQSSERLLLFLALHDAWDEALQLLRDDARRFPELASRELAAALERGASLRVVENVEQAMKRSALFLQLGSPLRARAALAPFIEAHQHERPFLDARVQIEVNERRFDAALSLLEAARGHVPGVEEDLLELRAARDAWARVTAEEEAQP